MRSLVGLAVLLIVATAARAELTLEVPNGARVRTDLAASDDTVTFRAFIPESARVRVEARGQSRGQTWTLRAIRAEDDREVATARGPRTTRIRDLVAPTTGWYRFVVSASGDARPGSLRKLTFRVSWSTPRKIEFEGPVAGGGLDVEFIAEAGATVRIRARSDRDAIPVISGIAGAVNGFEPELPPDADRRSRITSLRGIELAVTDRYVVRVGEEGVTGTNVRGSIRIQPPARFRGTLRAESARYASQGRAAPLFGGVIDRTGGNFRVDLPQAHPLMGSAVEVRAAATRRATAVVIGEAADFAPASPPLRPVSPAIYVGPTPRLFNEAIHVTIALDRDAFGNAPDGLLVYRRDADGVVSQVNPGTIEIGEGALTVRILTDDLATFRAFVPRSGALAVGSPVELKTALSSEPDRLGHAVAADGPFVVVGAPFTDGRTGSAHVFRLARDEWTLDGTLTPTEGAGDVEFGTAVAVSGETMVVGARFDDVGADDGGVCYVFDRVDGAWRETAQIRADDAAFFDQFGAAVALDGDTLVIGARLNDDHGERSGAVYVFERERGIWKQRQKLTAGEGSAGGEFGSSISLHGATLAIGAPKRDGGLGAVHVFERGEASWSLQQRLELLTDGPEEAFGHAVSIRGDDLVVGLDGGPEAAAYTYTRDARTWREGVRIGTGAPGGIAVAVRSDVLLIGNGGVDAPGTLRVLERDGGSWSQRAVLQSSSASVGDGFGAAAALTRDVIVVGAPGRPRGAQETGGATVLPLVR